jgi:hypothetical protein
MSLSLEEATFISNTRLKMVQNMQNDLPPEHGLDKEKLKECLALVRKDRSIGDATNSKAKGKAPQIPIDLKAFMAKK